MNWPQAFVLAAAIVAIAFMAWGASGFVLPRRKSAAPAKVWVLSYRRNAQDNDTILVFPSQNEAVRYLGLLVLNQGRTDYVVKAKVKEETV